ncbi:MAG: hypothetical protein MAG453_01624 [Calditrichaeota bacterium]|nr:hypothetical protein [Calditrichota bacterium]
MRLFIGVLFILIVAVAAYMVISSGGGEPANSEWVEVGSGFYVRNLELSEGVDDSARVTGEMVLRAGAPVDSARFHLVFRDGDGRPLGHTPFTLARIGRGEVREFTIALAPDARVDYGDVDSLAVNRVAPSPGYELR